MRHLFRVEVAKTLRHLTRNATLDVLRDWRHLVTDRARAVAAILTSGDVARVVQQVVKGAAGHQLKHNAGVVVVHPV